MVRASAVLCRRFPCAGPLISCNPTSPLQLIEGKVIEVED